MENIRIPVSRLLFIELARALSYLRKTGENLNVVFTSYYNDSSEDLQLKSEIYGAFKGISVVDLASEFGFSDVLADTDSGYKCITTYLWYFADKYRVSPLKAEKVMNKLCVDEYGLPLELAGYCDLSKGFCPTIIKDLDSAYKNFNFTLKIGLNKSNISLNSEGTNGNVQETYPLNRLEDTFKCIENIFKN